MRKKNNLNFVIVGKIKNIDSDFSVSSKNNNVFLEIINPDK